jgi:hypothetical protein
MRLTCGRIAIATCALGALCVIWGASDFPARSVRPATQHRNKELVLSSRKIRLFSDPSTRMELYSQKLESDTVFTANNAPSFVHVLGRASSQPEVRLKTGTWLVLAFNPASIRDVASIKTALGVGDCSVFSLGLLPFSAFSEIETWHHELEYHSSPIWIIIRDGRFVAERHGSLTESQFKEFITKDGVCGR